MPIVDVRAALRRFCILASAGFTASLGLWCLAPTSTESANANGDTRTLHLLHTHTGETIDATYRVDGRYDQSVLRQLNHFLRDWRNDDEHVMDPRLFDAVWEAYRTAGASDRIQIYSAYRSPQTNAMLRRRSRAVAEHSQHMLGKAMDTTMPGFPMSRIREAGMRLQHGGVGWYPSANFVHLDVGGVRSWPRMSYAQLASLFPDGKTVHISSDGRTLPGYDQARIEIAERGGTEVPPAQDSGGFFAWLFGNGNNGAAHEDEEERRAPVAVAAAPQPQPQPQTQPVAVASATPTEAVAPRPALGYADDPDSAAAATPAATRSAASQVASLAPARLPDADASGTSEAPTTPLPPRRPAGLASSDMLDIPLPPMRPSALDRMQTASIRYTDAQAASVTTSRAGLPSMRRAGLPSIITRGGEGRDRAMPSRILAFASSEAAELRPVPLPVSRPVELIKPLALRGARRRATVATVSVRFAAAPGLATGPRITGLRRAAKLMGDRASL